MDDSEGEPFVAAQLANMNAKSAGISDAGFPKLFRQRNGIPIQVQNEGCERVAANRAKPKSSGDRHGDEGMSRFKFPVNNLVANRRPTQLAMKRDVEAIFFVEAEFASHDERSSIAQRHKTETQRLSHHILIYYLFCFAHYIWQFALPHASLADTVPNGSDGLINAENRSRENDE